jgi:hypothetical protein
MLSFLSVREEGFYSTESFTVLVMLDLTFQSPIKFTGLHASVVVEALCYKPEGGGFDP